MTTRYLWMTYRMNYCWKFSATYQLRQFPRLELSANDLKNLVLKLRLTRISISMFICKTKNSINILHISREFKIQLNKLFEEKYGHWLLNKSISLIRQGYFHWRKILHIIISLIIIIPLSLKTSDKK